MTYWLIPFTLPMVAQSLVLTVVSVGWYWWGKPFIRRGVIRLPQRRGWDEWFDFVMTIGFVQWFSVMSPGDEALELHEVDVHTRQAEDLCVLGAIVGGVVAIADWRWGLGLWLSSGPLWQVPNFLTALIRYGRSGRRAGRKLWKIAYFGSEHERSAYAQEYRWTRTGQVVPWRH